MAFYPANDHVYKYFLYCPEITEDEAEDKLQDAIRERFSSFGNVSIFFSMMDCFLDLVESCFAFF